MAGLGYEIDFLPVGDGSKGGDAITFRYGNLSGSRHEQTVVVVDGGYTDDGEALVEHILTHYGTDLVDIVFSTHPDQDHIRGLQVVLENLTVTTLCMHVPERHNPLVAAAAHSFAKSALLGEALAKSLTDSDNLLAIAKRRGVEVVEPFAGVATQDGVVQVVGPTEEYYEEKLSAMKGAPVTLSLSASLRDLVTKAKEKLFEMVPETAWLETLTEGGDVSPSNNSSVVLLLDFDGTQVLLSGDAGAEALHQCLDRMELGGFVTGSLARCFHGDCAALN